MSDSLAKIRGVVAKEATGQPWVHTDRGPFARPRWIIHGKTGHIAAWAPTLRAADTIALMRNVLEPLLDVAGAMADECLLWRDVADIDCPKHVVRGRKALAALDAAAEGV